MKEIPNIEIEKQELNHYYSNYNNYGSESILLNYGKYQGFDSILKLYRPFSDTPFLGDYSKMIQNKYDKIRSLYQIEALQKINDIRFLATVSCEKKHVGYVMTKNKGTEFNLICGTQIEYLNYLKQICEKLKQFIKLGILYGDISGSNILVSGSNICLIDLDNVTYQNYPMDLMREYLIEFVQDYGKFDDKTVSYMFNIFTLATIYQYDLSEIRDIRDWIAEIPCKYFNYHAYLKIKEQMMFPTPRYEGYYFMDFLKPEYQKKLTYGSEWKLY